MGVWSARVRRSEATLRSGVGHIIREGLSGGHTAGDAPVTNRIECDETRERWACNLSLKIAELEAVPFS